MTRSKISALFAVGALCLLAAIPGAHARLGGNAGDFLQGGLLGSVGEGIGKGFGDKLGSLLGGAIVGTCECAHGGGAFGTCKESSLFAGNGGLQADCTKQGAEDTCEGQKNLVGKSFCKWKPSKLSGTVADVTKDLDPRNWGKMLGLERRLSGKKCGNAAGEAACIAACASVAGIPICLSDACYGPNGPDFSPSCGKDDHRRLAVGIFDKKPEGAICTYTPDCQGNLECYAAEMVGPIQVSRCQKSEGRRLGMHYPEWAAAQTRVPGRDCIGQGGLDVACIEHPRGNEGPGRDYTKVGIFDKKPQGYLCTWDTDCQGTTKCRIVFSFPLIHIKECW